MTVTSRRFAMKKPFSRKNEMMASVWPAATARASARVRTSTRVHAPPPVQTRTDTPQPLFIRPAKCGSKLTRTHWCVRDRQRSRLGSAGRAAVVGHDASKDSGHISHISHPSISRRAHGNMREPAGGNSDMRAWERPGALLPQKKGAVAGPPACCQCFVPASGLIMKQDRSIRPAHCRR